MKCVVRYSSHLRNTYSDASQAGVSLKPMEIAMVRVIFVLRAFILFFLLWTFFVAMIVNAYYHVALRCRNKQSIIKASDHVAHRCRMTMWPIGVAISNPSSRRVRV